VRKSNLSRGSRDRRTPRAEELEGFLAGLEFDLARLRREGTPDPTSERRLAQARRHLEKGELKEAERELQRIDERRRRRRSEVELIEIPRDLVSYVPKGERGSPPDRSEDPLANRLVLLGRLLRVRAAHGIDVESLIPELQAAEEAYRRGDRAKARSLADDVHAQLEDLGSGEAPASTRNRAHRSSP